jgi:hypothetical protein
LVVLFGEMPKFCPLGRVKFRPVSLKATLGAVTDLADTWRFVYVSPLALIVCELEGLLMSG